MGSLFQRAGFHDIAGKTDTPAEGVRLAAETVDSGAAAKKLDEFIKAGNRQIIVCTLKRLTRLVDSGKFKKIISGGFGGNGK